MSAGAYCAGAGPGCADSVLTSALWHGSCSSPCCADNETADEELKPPPEVTLSWQQSPTAQRPAALGPHCQPLSLCLLLTSPATTPPLRHALQTPTAFLPPHPSLLTLLPDAPRNPTHPLEHGVLTAHPRTATPLRSPFHMLPPQCQVSGPLTGREMSEGDTNHHAQAARQEGGQTSDMCVLSATTALRPGRAWLGIPTDALMPVSRRELRRIQLPVTIHQPLAQAWECIVSTLSAKCSLLCLPLSP